MQFPAAVEFLDRAQQLDVVALRAKIRAAEQAQRGAEELMAQLAQELEALLAEPKSSGSPKPPVDKAAVSPPPTLKPSDPVKPPVVHAAANQHAADNSPTGNTVAAPSPTPTVQTAAVASTELVSAPPSKTSTVPNPCAAAIRKSVMKSVSSVHLHPYMSTQTREQALNLLETYGKALQLERPGEHPSGAVITHSGKVKKSRKKKVVGKKGVGKKGVGKKVVVKKEKKAKKKVLTKVSKNTSHPKTRQRDEIVNYAECDEHEGDDEAEFEYEDSAVQVESSGEDSSGQDSSGQESAAEEDDNASNDRLFREAVSVAVGWTNDARYVYDVPSMTASMEGEVIAMAYLEDRTIRIHLFKVLLHYDPPQGKPEYNYELQYLTRTGGKHCDKCDVVLELARYAAEPAAGCVLSMIEEKSWVIVKESPQ
jgi:hypothetical protein